MKKLIDHLDSTLRSVRFTVILMLVIGGASIYGTVYPAKTPFDFNPYKSPVFVLLLFALALNIAYCTVRRLFVQVRARFAGVVSGRELVRIDGRTDDLAAGLKARGFAVTPGDSGVIAVKGRVRGVLVLASHGASALLLVFAGLSSATGFTGTTNVHVFDKIATCFDWRSKQDVPLPFEIYVDGSKTEYYPMPLKVSVVNIASGEERLVTTREQDVIDAGNVRLRLISADPASGSVTFSYLENGTERGPFVNTVSDGRLSLGVRMRAYIDPVPRQFTADVALFESGVEKVQKTISINNPLSYGGYTIYLVNTGKDDYGYDYVGFQITREPLIVAIWACCIVLCVALLFYPFVTEYHLRLVQDGEHTVVYGDIRGGGPDAVARLFGT